MTNASPFEVAHVSRSRRPRTADNASKGQCVTQSSARVEVDRLLLKTMGNQSPKAQISGGKSRNYFGQRVEDKLATNQRPRDS